MSNTRKIGYFGEDAVCEYLKGKGYNILARNYQIRGGEIDIIAEDKEYIIFVEVKTRKTGSMTGGLEAITKKKQSLIVKTAVAYMTKIGSNLQPRFDAVEVYMEKSTVTELNYIENAFDASGLNIIC